MWPAQRDLLTNDLKILQINYSRNIGFNKFRQPKTLFLLLTQNIYHLLLIMLRLCNGICVWYFKYPSRYFFNSVSDSTYISYIYFSIPSYIPSFNLQTSFNVIICLKFKFSDDIVNISLKHLYTIFLRIFSVSYINFHFDSTILSFF